MAWYARPRRLWPARAVEWFHGGRMSRHETLAAPARRLPPRLPRRCPRCCRGRRSCLWSSTLPPHSPPLRRMLPRRGQRQRGAARVCWRRQRRERERVDLLLHRAHASTNCSHAFRLCTRSACIAASTPPAPSPPLPAPPCRRRALSGEGAARRCGRRRRRRPARAIPQLGRPVGSNRPALSLSTTHFEARQLTSARSRPVLTLLDKKLVAALLGAAQLVGEDADVNLAPPFPTRGTALQPAPPHGAAAAAPQAAVTVPPPRAWPRRP